jgi:hypothetical protein
MPTDKGRIDTQLTDKEREAHREQEDAWRQRWFEGTEKKMCERRKRWFARVDDKK